MNEENFESGPYTALMPAGGWRVEFTKKDGSGFDEPLVGWALKNGLVVPLVTDCDGLVEDGDAWSGGHRVYHPGQRETPPARLAPLIAAITVTARTRTASPAPAPATSGKAHGVSSDRRMGQLRRRAALPAPA